MRSKRGGAIISGKTRRVAAVTLTRSASDMDGRALAEYIRGLMVGLAVMFLAIGAGLGYLIPWAWHHLSIGWK